MAATVFTNPRVDKVKVPSSVQVDWLSRARPKSSWVLEFQAVENMNSALATKKEIKEEASFLSDRETFKTPLKKRKDDEDLEFEDTTLGEVMFNSYERSLPADDSAEMEEVIATKKLEKGVLTRVVGRLETGVMYQGTVLAEVASLAHKRFLVYERDLRAIAGAVQNSQILIGNPVQMDARFEGPTLWSSTSFIADEVVRVGGGLAILEGKVDPMSDIVSEIKKECERLAKEVKTDKLLKVLLMVSEKMKEACDEIVELKTKVGDLESELDQVTKSKAGGGKAQADSPKSGDVVDDLLFMLDGSMKGGKGDVGKRGEGSGMTGEIDRGLSFEDGAFAKKIALQVKMLMDEVSVLKSCTEDKSVKFASLGLRSIQECQNWIDLNFKGYRYGLIMDPLLMLDRIFGSDDGESDSEFKTLEYRVKLKITTGAEAAAIKALYFKRPRIFHKGRVAMTTERNKSKLNRIPDFKTWKAGGEGVKQHIINQMNMLHISITHDISYTFGVDSTMQKAQLLAMTSINTTLTFLTQLLGFIDTIYDKLFTFSKFTADQAWALTTQILDRICEDLFAPKEGVAAAMMVEDPASICAHMLWACFKTHDVMALYMEHNFENHPAISAEYIKFLATNSGFEKVERLEASVTEMKASVQKAVVESGKARSIADGVSSQVGVITKNVEAAGKRVAKLEDKVFK